MGRAWVVRHGISTYKDTTPHISFRTGPPSSKHKDGRPSRSVPSLYSCLCRRGTSVTARARKRIRMLRWIAPCIARSSSVGEPKRALGRAIHLNLRFTITRCCRSRCHVSQVRHQHYGRSPGTDAICRATSASPTSPMRSVARWRSARSTAQQSSGDRVVAQLGPCWAHPSGTSREDGHGVACNRKRFAALLSRTSFSSRNFMDGSWEWNDFWHHPARTVMSGSQDLRRVACRFGMPLLPFLL